MTQAWMQAWAPGDKLPEAFLALPKQVYEGDPHWLPEDPATVQTQFGPGNDWFRDGQAWVGVVPGRARLAGFCRQQVIDGEPAAFFGFWEGMDDLAAHAVLFDGLRDWARAQGAKRLYGPINFTTFGMNRIRLDGFEHGAFPGEPWNPAYYASLMDRLGLAIRHRYVTAIGDIDAILASVTDEHRALQAKLASKVSIEAMTPAIWNDNLTTLHGFVDHVFGGNFAYTHLSEAAFRASCGPAFSARFCPRTSVLARGLDGRIAGFFLVFPDYSPLLRQGQPQPQRLSDSELSYAEHAGRLPRPSLALAKTVGVHPDFRVLGLFKALGGELSLRAKGVYDMLGGALIRDDNHSREFAQRHADGHERRYGLYHAEVL